MTNPINTLIKNDTIMFEYDVHDMRRAVAWYKDVLGFEVIFAGGDCHTEFALPVKGARLALSWVEPDAKIEKAARLFIRTPDIYAVEAYLQGKGVKTKPVENVDNVVLILWVEDSEGNHFAFEQWLARS
ncbi:MAG: VOC family protein [Anaerolineae bacterium]|nr:VOC family protein [Anaerolineae bacterium]